MTSLAEQNEQELGGRTSVLARQKRDHIRLDQLLAELAATDPTDQRRVLTAPLPARVSACLRRGSSLVASAAPGAARRAGAHPPGGA